MIVAVALLAGFEKIHLLAPRKRALDKILDHIRFEDDQTYFSGVGAVSKAMNLLVSFWADGPLSERFRMHRDAIPYFFFMSPHGMVGHGTDGCQIWDACFVTQALYHYIDAFGGNLPEIQDMMSSGIGFIRGQQCIEPLPRPQKYYRMQNQGGFAFSTRKCGWMVSDCTAEGLRTLLLEPCVDPQRCQWAVDRLLDYCVESDGGVASYETRRGPQWLEQLDVALVFSCIMVEYPYVECTAATVLALSEFRARFPNYRSAEIEHNIEKCTKFILSSQRLDGSWYGSWAICFTYATWWALEALSSRGHVYHNSYAHLHDSHLDLMFQNTDQDRLPLFSWQAAIGRRME